MELQPVSGAPKVFVIAGAAGGKAFSQTSEAGHAICDRNSVGGMTGLSVSKSIGGSDGYGAYFQLPIQNILGRQKELIDSCETVLTVFDRTEWTKLPEGLKEILAYAEKKANSQSNRR